MERCQIPLAFYFLFLCVAQQASAFIFFRNIRISIRMAVDSVQLFVGREAVIFCNVTSRKTLTVKWLINGTELKDGDLNISVSPKEGKKAKSIKSSLHFSEVDRRHAGFFSCEAENKFLTKKRNIQVSVTCEGTLVVISFLSRHSLI